MPKSGLNYIVCLYLKFSDKVSFERRTEMNQFVFEKTCGDHSMEEHTFRMFPIQDGRLSFMCGSRLAPRFIRKGVNDMIGTFYPLFADKFNDVDPEDVSIRHMILDVVAATANPEDFLKQPE